MRHAVRSRTIKKTFASRPISPAFSATAFPKQVLPPARRRFQRQTIACPIPSLKKLYRAAPKSYFFKKFQPLDSCEASVPADSPPAFPGTAIRKPARPGLQADRAEKKSGLPPAVRHRIVIASKGSTICKPRLRKYAGASSPVASRKSPPQAPRLLTAPAR